MRAADSARPRAPSRRVGYIINVLVNAAMFLAMNWWPGWEVVPFLTPEMRLVVGFVNASIFVNLAANLVYLAADDRAWLKALGDVITLGVGTAALVRLWQVFPFDFGSSSFDWNLIARSVLVLGIVGSIIGMIAAVSTFARAASVATTDQAA